MGTAVYFVAMSTLSTLPVLLPNTSSPYTFGMNGNRPMDPVAGTQLPRYLRGCGNIDKTMQYRPQGHPMNKLSFVCPMQRHLQGRGYVDLQGRWGKDNQTYKIRECQTQGQGQEQGGASARNRGQGKTMLCAKCTTCADSSFSWQQLSTTAYHLPSTPCFPHA